MSDYNYQETYDDFWKEIVELPDGSLDVDQVKRELHDYLNLMDNASSVYVNVTDGLISKPNAEPSVVVSEYERVLQNDIDETVRQILNKLLDHLQEDGASLESTTWLINHLYEKGSA